MNPLFRKLYKHKKTRVRDPNAPPPPNLFSTVKDLKDTKAELANGISRLSELERKIERLEAQNRYLQSVVDMLQNYVRRK